MAAGTMEKVIMQAMRMAYNLAIDAYLESKRVWNARD